MSTSTLRLAILAGATMWVRRVPPTVTRKTGILGLTVFIKDGEIRDRYVDRGKITRMFSTISGLQQYVSDGTYRGAWISAEPEEIHVGDHVEYWRCGDQSSESFTVPPAGEIFTVYKGAVLGSGPWEFVTQNPNGKGEDFGVTYTTRSSQYRSLVVPRLGENPDVTCYGEELAKFLAGDVSGATRELPPAESKVGCTTVQVGGNIYHVYGCGTVHVWNGYRHQSQRLDARLAEYAKTGR